ncbi:hypothetical protein B0T11DRAFT_88401 [Plectosphaerella cucumerina]|uniref:Uncharacterized protein n=1 Tax=Plectosphaerella cucumerina TaxID=40658 RepID=A0A8K0TIS1_9PEZI|nr:hypothetical protein B0T11DRAFT_88401 [Plectosphaerella cucumerina]
MTRATPQVLKATAFRLYIDEATLQPPPASLAIADLAEQDRSDPETTAGSVRRQQGRTASPGNLTELSQDEQPPEPRWKPSSIIGCPVVSSPHHGSLRQLLPIDIQPCLPLAGDVASEPPRLMRLAHASWHPTTNLSFLARPCRQAHAMVLFVRLFRFPRSCPTSQVRQIGCWRLVSSRSQTLHRRDDGVPLYMIRDSSSQSFLSGTLVTKLPSVAGVSCSGCQSIGSGSSSGTPTSSHQARMIVWYSL